MNKFVSWVYFQTYTSHTQTWRNNYVQAIRIFDSCGVRNRDAQRNSKLLSPNGKRLFEIIESYKNLMKYSRNKTTCTQLIKHFVWFRLVECIQPNYLHMIDCLGYIRIILFLMRNSTKKCQARGYIYHHGSLRKQKGSFGNSSKTTPKSNLMPRLYHLRHRHVQVPPTDTYRMRL